MLLTAESDAKSIYMLRPAAAPRSQKTGFHLQARRHCTKGTRFTTPIYQSIFNLASISEWKSTPSRVSSPKRSQGFQPQFPSRTLRMRLQQRKIRSEPPRNNRIEKHSPTKTSSHPTSISLPAKISPLTPALFPNTLGLHSPSRAIFSSIPLLTGSAIPNVRRSPSIFSASCVARQRTMRASSGWVDWRVVGC